MPLFVIERHIHHHYPDSESSTLTPLLQNMMETIMAQIDDLMTVLGAIHDDVTNLLAKAQGLEAQLTQLQQSSPPQVDLQSAIDAATAIRQQLEGTASTTGTATGADTGTASTSDTSTSTNDTSAPTEPASVSDTASADTSASEQPTEAPADPAAGTAEQPTA